MNNSHLFEMNIPLGGLGAVVKMDGTDISDAISSINLNAGVDGYTNVTLTMPAPAAVTMVAALHCNVEAVRHELLEDKDTLLLPAVNHALAEAGLKFLSQDDEYVDSLERIAFAEKFIAALIERNKG